MARYNLEQIKKEVRILMYRNENYDELSPIEEGTGLVDLDNLKIEELIEEVIPFAIDKVYQAAPSELLADAAIDTSVESGIITWDNTSDEYASVGRMDRKILSLILVRLPEWEKPVVHAEGFGDALYSEYRSEFAGIRPTVHKPAVAYGLDWGSDKTRIEAYPKGSTANSVVKFIPKFDASEDITEDGVNIASSLYAAILYTIANLVYVSLGDNDRATMMANEAVELISNLPSAGK